MKAASFRETSHVAAGNTKHKVQPGAPGPGGHARPGRGGHPQPQPCTVPMQLYSAPAFPHLRALAVAHFQVFPSQLSPRMPAALGSHQTPREEEPPRREGEDSLPLKK